MTQPTNIHATIAAANDGFMETFKNGDAAGMAALYTQDGQVLPPNGDFVTGQQAIQAFWQAIFDMGIKDAKLEIVEVERRGDMVFEVSKFSLLDGDRQLLDQGKYIVIWKQVQGQWKLHRDIFNSSMPASA